MELNGDYGRKRSLRPHLVLMTVMVALVALVAITCRPVEQRGEGTPLRVAWMTSWATAGQVVEAVIHTDILEETGTVATFQSFLFGPPMNEAALAGDVDITIVGDMPAIILLAQSQKWSVVGRTLYFPYGLMVREDSPAESVEDLRGRTVGVPFGSGPQPTLYRWLEEAGLRIGQDVDVINILPNEMAEAIQARRVDAIMTWEPTMTLLEQQGSARTIREEQGVGFMCMRSRYIAEHPANAARFMEAWRRALLYTARHRSTTDEWFAADSRFPVDLLAKIRVVDPNLWATSLEEVTIFLSGEDIEKNQRKAEFAYEQGLIPDRILLEERVNQEFWQ